MTTFGKRANDEEFYARYMKAADEMMYLVIKRFQKFWLHSDFIHNLLGHKKHESELLKTVNDISNEVGY